MHMTATQELVIDPAISFSSFLGGGAEDVSSGFAIDDSTPGSPKLYLSGFTTLIRRHLQRRTL